MRKPDTSSRPRPVWTASIRAESRGGQVSVRASNRLDEDCTTVPTADPLATLALVTPAAGDASPTAANLAAAQRSYGFGWASLLAGAVAVAWHVLMRRARMATRLIGVSAAIALQILLIVLMMIEQSVAQPR